MIMTNTPEDTFFEGIFAAIGAIVMIIDASGLIIRMNDAAERFMGYLTADVQGQPYFWERFIPPDERPEVHNIFESMHSRTLPKEVENHWVSCTGEKRLFHWTNTIMDNSDGQPAYLITVGTDITEQMRLSTALRRSREFHTLRSHANKAIAQACEKNALLQEICDLAIQYTHLGLIWIGRPDEEGWFQFLSASGRVGYLDGIRISTRPDLPEGNGPTGRIWRERQLGLIHVTAMATDPTMSPWQYRARSYGLKSNLTLPIDCGGQIWAVLVVYHVEEDVFDEELQEVMADLAQDIGFGLDRLNLADQERAASHLNSILLNSLTVGVNVMRYPERVIERINPRMLDIYGAASEGEIIGHAGREFYPDDDNFLRVGAFAEIVLKNGQGMLRDVAYRRVNDAIIYVDLSGQRFDLGDGIDRIIWTHVDVTERHQHELRIRALNAQKQLLLDNTVAGIHVVRYPERIIVETNQRFVDMMGYDYEDDISNMSITNIYPNDDENQRMVRLSEEVLQNGHGFLRDLIIRTRNGQHEYLDIQGKRLDSETESEHPLILWTSVNVTERHRHLENWMHEAKMRLNLINNMAIGILLISLDRMILRANRRITDLFGYNEDELIGQSTLILHGSQERFRKFDNNYLQLANTTSGIIYIQHTFRKKDGSTFTAEVTGAWLDPDDHEQGIIATIQDISEKLAMQEEIQANHERLQRELELASKLQRTFLPQHTPVLNGVNVAWEYIPSDYLAGDMLSAIMLDDLHLAFYVLDVMGHGVSAALNAIAIQYFIRPSAFANERGMSFRPGELLTYLNRRFGDFLLTETFFTLCYGVLDLSTFVLTYANGGHPAPLLAHHNGEVEALQGGNIPLGINMEEEFEEFQWQMLAGDKLILYSDGLTEVFNDNSEMFSKKRVTDLMAQHRDLSIQSLIHRFVSALEDFSNKKRWNDDVTVIGLEITDSVPLNIEMLNLERLR